MGSLVRCKPSLNRQSRSNRAELGRQTRVHCLNVCGQERRETNSSQSASMTSVALSFRATRIIRHSRVNSSMMQSIRNAFPSWVRSATKSHDQTWLGRSGRSRMHEPSLSHRRPRLGCLVGTFSPSHRQIYSTASCSLFTVHPAKLAFHHPKDMLDLGTDLSEPSIALALRQRQRAPGFCLENPQDTRCFRLLPVVTSAV